MVVPRHFVAASWRFKSSTYIRSFGLPFDYEQFAFAGEGERAGLVVLGCLQLFSVSVVCRLRFFPLVAILMSSASLIPSALSMIAGRVCVSVALRFSWLVGSFNC